jgi:tetratricopeptide (TPR) repeat protein
MASRQESAPVKKTLRRTGEGAGNAQKVVAPAEGAQAETYERAVEAFQRGDYSAAKELFERAAQGPMLEMAHAARLRAKMCGRREARRELTLATADEHYDYAVSLMNEGKLSQAERHLLLAITQTPQGGHLYYALALCRGLAGDFAGAQTNLKRAIELDPRNRIAARNDPDFAEISTHPTIAALLYPELKPA